MQTHPYFTVAVRYILPILLGLFGALSVGQPSTAYAKDAWANIWTTEPLASMDLAWLDRDASKVVELATSSPSNETQLRILFLKGLAARTTGDLQTSARVLGEAADLAVDGSREDRGLAPYVRFYRALVLLDIGGDRGAEARSILDDLRKFRKVLPQFDLHLGRAFLADGDPDAAAALLIPIKPRRGHDLYAHRDHVYYFQGLALWRRGQKTEARKLFRKLVLDHPSSPRAAAALPILDLNLNAAARIQMAEGFLSARHYKGASKVLESVGEQTSGSCHQILEVGDKLGDVKYSWERVQPELAVDHLIAVSKAGAHRAGDAQYTLARAYMKIGENDRALSAWAELLERFPSHRNAGEGLYHLGWIPMDEERWDEAIGPLHRYAKRWPDGKRANQSRWYIGWSHYRAGRYSKALRAWEALEPHARSALERGKVIYWLGVVHDALGNRSRAERRWLQVQGLYPSAYYGILASVRLGVARGKTLGPLHEDTIPDAQTVWAQMELLTPPLRARLRLIRDLLHVGLLTEARRAADRGMLRAVEAELRKSGMSAERATEYTFFIQEEVGDVARTWRGYSPKLWEIHREGVTRSNAKVWRRIFPRPYRRIVEHEAARRGIPATLVWSVMQKESVYDPDALSYADAMGLMQIIPITGRKIAARLGEPYRDGMLFDPHQNIAYSAWYLAELLRKFHGQLPLAIGSYNGGPVAMASWVNENAQRDVALGLDGFVEEIALDQARGYTRKVLTILGRYIMVYGFMNARDPGQRGVQVTKLYPELVIDRYLDNINF